MANQIRKVQVKNAAGETITVPAAISLIYWSNDVTASSKNNLNLVTESTDIIGGKGGKINIESASDIQFKPGDDVIFYSHHRSEENLDEVNIKNTDGNDNPVKLQLTATGLTFQNAWKTNTGNHDEVFNVNVNTGGDNGSNDKGYLKVRARAIDLRCEDHGGIALQPKGTDSENHMNKIKFEHGGGDGLEFGTFNAEKTSIFTDEYRFNRDGVVKMATRTKTERDSATDDKYDASDPTTHYTYEKQSDDFYDVIAEDDEQTTWHDIIKTASALNKTVHDDTTNTNINRVEVEFTDGDNLQIQTKSYTTGGSTIKPKIKFNAVNDIEFTTTDKVVATASKSIELTSAKNIKLATGSTNSLDISGCPKVNVTMAESGTYDPLFTFIPVGGTSISCSLSDIIKAVNYIKGANPSVFA